MCKFSKNCNYFLSSPIELYTYEGKGEAGYFIFYDSLKIDHSKMEVLERLLRNFKINETILD